MSTGLDIQTVLAQARGVALDLSGAAVAAFESRCALTKSECEGLHFSACRSRLPRGECTSNDMTVVDCLEEDCGVVHDFSNPTGESVDAMRLLSSISRSATSRSDMLWDSLGMMC